MNFFLIFMILISVININTFKIKVKVTEGIIIGNREATVFDEKFFYAFYGVPYAQAPIGKLRFNDPKPVKKWKQPLDATTEYRGACAQAHIVHKQGQYGYEDCLYLNIYTPFLPKHNNKEILKAVIVWIHGYAFTSSFSHIHGPDFLIENDILFITLTHRLNAFGFLKINETDSNVNMGLKDIILGFKWIRKNIDRFGGNKENITVMASGSASTFISLILATKYKKFFSKVILQSGSLFSPSIFQGDYIIEKETLGKKIKVYGYSDLKLAPVDVLIQASSKIYTSKDVIDIQRPVIPFLPTFEKESKKALVTASIYHDVINENINFKIPVLVGFTSQESITEMIPFIHNPHYLRAFQGLFKFMVPFSNRCRYMYSNKIYKEISNKIRKNYFKNNICEDSLDEFLKYSSDLYKYPIYKFINLRTKLGHNLFVYKFNYIGKLNVAKATSLAGTNRKIKGAAQGDEICYILKCEPQWETYVKLKNQTNDNDRKFIKQISQMWANFAKTGTPTNSNSFNNITWSPMSSKEDNIFFFDKVNSRLLNSKSEQIMFKFWNQIFDEYYAPEKCKNFKDEL